MDAQRRLAEMMQRQREREEQIADRQASKQGSSSTTSSSQGSETTDHATGDELASKLGHEKSLAKAGQMSTLYEGNIQEWLPSGGRIRDIKKYLVGGGYDPDEIEVIQRSRPASSTRSSSTNTSSQG